MSLSRLSRRSTSQHYHHPPPQPASLLITDQVPSFLTPSFSRLLFCSPPTPPLTSRLPEPNAPLSTEHFKRTLDRLQPRRPPLSPDLVAQLERHRLLPADDPAELLRTLSRLVHHYARTPADPAPLLRAIRLLPDLHRAARQLVPRPSHAALHKHLCALVRRERALRTAEPLGPAEPVVALALAAIETDEALFSRRVLALLRRHPLFADTPISTPALLELWRAATSRRLPAPDWLEWLATAAVSRHAPVSWPDRVELTRLLALSIGLLLRSLRWPAPVHPAARTHRLWRWLALIDRGDALLLDGLPSGELLQRRVQITDLLGTTDDDQLWMHVDGDPYTVASALRRTERLAALVECWWAAGDRLVGAMRVVCRGKGHLLVRAPGGAYECLPHAAAARLLARAPCSVWRTGLVLALAETLVAQIRILLAERANWDSMAGVLAQLLALELGDNPEAVYGGAVERHRLLVRQADGLELLLADLVARPLPPLCVVLDQLAWALARRGPAVVRVGTWKRVVGAYLERSWAWHGPGGLRRLLALLGGWARARGPDEERVRFAKICPADAGLWMVERVVFPADGEDEPVSRVAGRISLMERTVGLFGQPRRFVGRRLMRLVFLCVERRRKSGVECFGWWTRPDVWRELADGVQAAQTDSTNGTLSDGFSGVHQELDPAAVGSHEQMEQVDHQREIVPVGVVKNLANHLDSVELELRKGSREFFGHHSVLNCLMVLFKEWWVMGRRNEEGVIRGGGIGRRGDGRVVEEVVVGEEVGVGVGQDGEHVSEIGSGGSQFGSGSSER